MHCSSPRLKRGLDDVRGVHRAFGRAGAHDGVQLVNEQNDVLRAANLVHDRLDALLELAAILGAGDHQRQVQGDDPLVTQQLGHVAGGDFLGQTFDDRRLAHACLAQQHRVVLGAAAQNLNHALDLVLAADDRVHLAFAGDLGQVASEGLERGRLDLALLLRGRLFRRLAGGGFLLGGEVGIEFLQDFLAGLFDVHVEVLEHAGGDAIALAEQAEQDVLGADVGVIEGLGFLLREGEDLLHARRVGDVAHHLLIGPGADLLFDFQADRLEVQAELLQDIDRDALAQFDEPEQRCSVPTKLWLKRSASLRASASTCCARGVKLFIAS